MIEIVLVVAIGLIGGVAVGTQAPIAGAMAQRIGGASSSLIVHLGGAVASLGLLVARKGELIQARNYAITNYTRRFFERSRRAAISTGRRNTLAKSISRKATVAKLELQ